MYSKITTVPDENGMVIRQSKNNPEYGFVVLKQTKTSISSNPSNPSAAGWVRAQDVTTLLKGKMEELEMMNFTKDTVLDGKIVVLESLEPFSEEQPDRDLKIAGSTGVVCTKDGQPIYRTTFYSSDINAQDLFVQHDNVEEIRSANGLTDNKVKATATLEEAFDINNDENEEEMDETMTESSVETVDEETGEIFDNAEELEEVEDQGFEL